MKFRTRRGGVSAHPVITVLLLLLVLQPCWTWTSTGRGTNEDRAVWAPHSSPGARTFGHIVLVTLDGASKTWVDGMMAENTLPTLASLRTEGAELEVRIVDHTTTTDPGIACIESGYGPDITGVDRNYFDSTTKKSVPDGLSTGERIKKTFPGWKIGLVMPWTQAKVNVTSSIDSTLWNQGAETDYWFSSENVTWSSHSLEVRRNALDFNSALLTADFVASKAAEFIRANKGSSFYLRVHFVEPDHAGHAYGEAISGKITTEYKNALIVCDAALKTIVDALKEEDIYNETAVLVTTDHGFRGASHSEPPYPYGPDEVTMVWLVSNYAGIKNPLGWILQDDISPTCLALAGVNPSSFTPLYSLTSHALAAWEPDETVREVTPPKFVSINYPKQIPVGESFSLTVTVADASGILTVILMYNYSTVGWRGATLTSVNGTTFSGSLGPFNQEFTVFWYVKAVDNSTSRNVAYYPADRTPIATPVQSQFLYWALPILGVAVAAVLGVTISLRRRRRRASA